LQDIKKWSIICVSPVAVQPKRKRRRKRRSELIRRFIWISLVPHVARVCPGIYR